MYCTKKSAFTDTLLQDITIFNGSNSSHLDDWLIGVETIANLTSESRTKLAQAKSKGLTHTLISDALNSDKSWEEIKDLLHLKICNLDIHTSVSRFMEIQQKERESLAAYIHRFKRKAKTCNFTNNAATIHIFVKGRKSSHTLAAHVYEKGAQTLSDAISEVEKLQATQQLTTTLLPSYTVKMMSNEGDQCFECQELGHIACYCHNIRCFDCNEYGHVAADCPDRIPPSGTPAHQKRHCSNTRHCTRSTSRHHRGDRHRYTGPDPSHIPVITKVTVRIVHTHTEATPYHTTDALTKALHVTITQALIIIATTCHTEAHPLTPGITADLEHILHTN